MEFKRSAKKHSPAPQPPVAAPSSPPPSRENPGQLHINIDLGALTRLPYRSKEAFHQLTRKKRSVIVAATITLLVVGSVSYYVFVINKDDNQATTAPTVNKLDYQTLTPSGKPTEKLGGWHRVSPPDSAPAYAFSDTIDGVEVTVTQQPLPDKFIEGTDAQLDELAKSFSATNEIKADDVKVYVGTSAKGPQSAIMIKDGLLILIKSQDKISDDAWARYAESLK